MKGSEEKTVMVEYKVTNGYPVDSLLLSYHKGRIALACSYYDGMY
jgi:hypothetical protein